MITKFSVAVILAVLFGSPAFAQDAGSQKFLKEAIEGNFAEVDLEFFHNVVLVKDFSLLLHEPDFHELVFLILWSHVEHLDLELELSALVF